MKLMINLRHLEKGPQFLKGSLSLGEIDLDLHDDMVKPGAPIAYEFQATKQPQGIHIKGLMETVVECTCVRCLKCFESVVQVDPWETLILLDGEEKVEIEGDCADLTPFLREDMLLNFPHHPVCEAGCEILKRPVSDKPESEESSVKPVDQSNVWSALDKLNLEP